MRRMGLKIMNENGKGVDWKRDDKSEGEIYGCKLGTVRCTMIMGVNTETVGTHWSGMKMELEYYVKGVL